MTLLANPGYQVPFIDYDGQQRPFVRLEWQLYLQSLSTLTNDLEITVETTDTSNSIIFNNDATGQLKPKSSTGLTFAADTETLTATLITATSGITVDAGGVTITAGGLTVSAGNVAVTLGNVDIVAGTLDVGAAVTIDTGGLTITAGGETITAGGLTLTTDNVVLSDGTMFMAEQAAKDTLIASHGQWWVKTGAPCLPYFTDDADTDFELLTETSSDALYLRLAADNDPLTGTLTTQAIEADAHGTRDIGTDAVQFDQLHTMGFRSRNLKSSGPTYVANWGDDGLSHEIAFYDASTTGTINITNDASSGADASYMFGIESACFTDLSAHTIKAIGAVSMLLNCSTVSYGLGTKTTDITANSSATGGLLSGHALNGAGTIGSAQVILNSTYSHIFASALRVSGTGDSLIETKTGGSGNLIQGIALVNSANDAEISITAGPSGAMARGLANAGAIKAQDDGVFVTGRVNASGALLTAIGKGSSCFGNIGGVDGTISSGGLGSFATGHIGSSGNTQSITASADGAFGGGFLDSAANITASGQGSFAWGSTSGSTSIVASATNAVQFGPGTNNVASSLQVGDVWVSGHATVGVRANADGNFQFDGSLTATVTTATTTPHTAGDEYIILADDDTLGSALTVDLPAVATSEGIIYYIKKLGSTANVIVDGNASETIDGATTATLTTQYEAITVACDGTVWWII